MNPNEQEQSIIEHLEELRSRLFKTAIFFIVAIFVGFYTAEPIIRYIKLSDEASNFTLHAFKVTDPLSVYLTVTLFVAMLITSPVLLYQLWAFATPGLYESERKATLKYIPYSVILFLGGITFGYFVLFPFVMKFMMGLGKELEIVPTIGIDAFFSFLFKLVIPFGFLFQLPVIALFFSRIGLLNPKLMIKFRKYSYFVLFVIAVLLAPPDVVSYIIISIPLFILYEISIKIAQFGYRKYEVAEAQRVKEEEERTQELQVAELLEKQRIEMERMQNQT